MLIIAILVAVAFFTAWHKTRLHFNGRLPAFRLESTQQNGLQVRRYPSAVVAEVRVSGTASGALHSGYMVLNKYFRDERIGRYALPVLAEKVDAADSIWCDRRAHFHARTGWPFCRAASASPWGSRGPAFSAPSRSAMCIRAGPCRPSYPWRSRRRPLLGTRPSC